MSFPSWVARALGSSAIPSRRRRRASRRKPPSALRPHLETLEDRTLPSIDFTNFSVPPAAASSGQLTLNGTIADTNYPSNPPNTVQVKIGWGDGASKTTAATLSSFNPATGTGIYAFAASYTYANPPSPGNPVFTVTATASDSTGDSTPATEAALAVDGLQGNANIAVEAGGSGLAKVTVAAFSGDFQVPVAGGPIVVFGGPSATAPDTITVNENLALPVAVYGGSQDALTVQDPAAADTIAMTSNTVTANGGTVTYSGLSRLLVSGLGGGAAVNMTGIAASVDTTVDGVSGNTSFHGTFGSTGFTGNLILANFTAATLADTGDLSGDLTVKGPGNLQQLSVAGTVAAGSSISVAGTLSATTIGVNAGTINAGAISTMSVATNSGTIRATGPGTTSNVSIGTNTGTFTAVEDGSGTGTMTSTTIGTNSGTVSAGSISTMSVTTNGGSISAAGQGTTSNVSIGTNTGTFTAVEDGNSGSGTMTSTTIGTNSGTVSAGSISTMSVTTNGGSISAAGQGTTSNVSIGTNSGTFTAVEDGNSGSGTMTSTTIGTNSGTVSAGSISTMSVTTNGGSISAAGQGTTSNVHIGTNNGTFAAVVDRSRGSGTMTSTTIGTNNGAISSGSIEGISIAANYGSISAAAPGPGDASDVIIGTLGASGTLTVSGTLASLQINVFSGVVTAGHIDTIVASNAPAASQMLKVTEGGVTRSLVLTPAAGNSLPSNGSFNYVYTGTGITGSGDPQLTLAVNEGAGFQGSYDVELLSSSALPGSGFDLAALYNSASTPAHIRNVLIEGNLTPSAADASQVGILSDAGGVQLPGVALASVGVMGNAPAGSIAAASVEAVSFASITESGGTITAPTATPWDAAQLLAPGTAIVPANSTFLAAAGQTAQGQSQPVALFLDTGTHGAFDSRNVLLGNEAAVLGESNPVLSQITAASNPRTPSTIQTITLSGDGGSIQTAQPIFSAITSSYALGDLTLLSSQGIEADISAASIFGNIFTNGPISGVIQTTSGDIGRTLTANGSVIGVTTISANGAITGQILSAGDLVSQIAANAGFSGVLAAGGNLGYLDPSTQNRFGGLSVNGGFDGEALVLGNIYGDISINGGLDGRIAAQGTPRVLGSGRQGMLGNIWINGGVRSDAAIVSGGEIGDAGLGTSLHVNGAVKGILAAAGPITYRINGTTKFAHIFNNVGDPNSPQYAGGANEDAIHAIFIGDLAAMLTNLNNLHVGSDGNLSDS